MKTSFDRRLGFVLVMLAGSAAGIGGAAVIPIEVQDAVVTEGTDRAEIVVRLRAVQDREVQVECRTVAGTATAGLDYVETAMSLTFAKGETNRVLYVPLVDDGWVEPEETVRLLLNASLGTDQLKGRTEATLTILDNEQVDWVDTDYVPELAWFGIYNWAPAPEGRMVLVGYFPVAETGAEQWVVRLNADGSMDRTFVPGAQGGTEDPRVRGLEGVAVQPDGAVLIGYWSYSTGGGQAWGLARLRPDGSLDSSFHPVLESPTNSVPPRYLRFGLQPDGGIIAFVQYSDPEVGWPGVSRLLRLHADGSIDPLFQGQQSLEPQLVEAYDSSLIVLGNGGIIVSVRPGNGLSRGTLWRLHPDGTLDTNFLSAARNVWELAEYPDGGLVVSGWDSSPVGGGRCFLVRLREDGSLDPTFAPDFSGGCVSSIAVGEDGTVVVGGSFTQVDGLPRVSVARLLPDGSVDTGFRGPSWPTNGTVGVPYTSVDGVRLQADGKILIRGGFGEIEGQLRPGLARLKAQLSSTGGPEWTMTTHSVDEAAGEVVLPVRRTGDASQEVRVRYHTVEGSAKAGSDFVPVDGTLILSPLQSNSEIRIQIVNDGTTESEESLHVMLEPTAPGAPIGVARDTEVRIVDNDFGIQFSYWSRPATEGDAFASILLERRGDDLRALQVAYTVVGGTATEGTDYIGANGFVTFEAGALETMLRIPLLDDGFDEGEETVEVRLVDPENRGILGQFTNATVVVRDNERPGLRVDPSFVPHWEGSDLAEGSSGISQLFVQDGARILLDTWLQGLQDPLPRHRIVRLDANGTEDPSFSPATNTTALLAVSGDGRILALTDTGLVRFERDGALDSGFQNRLGTADGSPPSVHGALVQPDGKILIWGGFNSVNGVGQTNVARLERDGAPDSGFLGIPPVDVPPVESGIADMAWASEGHYIVAIWRYYPSGGPVPPIGEISVQRWDSQGRPEPDFQWTSQAESGLGLGGPLVLSPEGKILVNVRVWARYLVSGWLVRLGPDGSVDYPFGTLDRGHYDAPTVPEALALQSDGSLLVWVGGGYYSGPVYPPVLRRLHPDGSADRGFQPGEAPVPYVQGFRLLGESSAVVWGSVYRPDDTSRPSLAKLDVASPPAAGARFATNLLSVSEGDSEVLLPVIRLGDTTGRMVVDYTTEDDSAHAGIEYLHQEGQVVFEPLQTTTSLHIPILDNAWPNLDTTFEVVLHSSSDRVLTIPPGNRVKVRIVDDDRPGGVDALLNAGNLWSEADSLGAVAAIEVQPDGRIIVGGITETVQGSWSARIARLQPDGMLDSSFAAGTGSPDTGGIRAMALQGDGSILIGGDFESINGVSRFHLARLHPDGSVDLSFDPKQIAATSVQVIALQSNGRVLVAGQNFSAGGGLRYGLVGLRPDGSLDEAFAPAFSPSDSVLAISVLADDRLLVGGWFDSVNGVTCRGLVRLRPNGSVDPGFNASGTDFRPVKGLVPDRNGSLLVSYPGPSYTGVLVRLLSDGRVDPSFTAPERLVGPVALLADGQILVTRNTWETYNVGHSEVLRLHPDGSRDLTFDGPEFGAETVNTIVVQGDGAVLVGGSFAAADGLPRANLVRLNVTDPPPIFSSISWTSRGASLTLHGLPGRRHLIEASDGLPVWFPIMNVTPSLEVPTFRVDILDPNAAGVSQRFYRAVRLAP